MVHTYVVNNYFSIKKQLNIIFVLTLACDKEMLMKQKKVKMRMTRSKSQKARRRTRDEKCVIISNGALVCLTSVASGSVAKRSLSALQRSLAVEVRKVNGAKKSENANDTKQITEGT
ncbi:hypothetical protein T4E_10872 [Trichinella pseudospiralis]|uniref:Uncharacterized protein n=1 Tax=Trichinella pseudospiralis TaxID=6337 RepID=A0A0V0YA10_TRIPS|nr:hypothetical protein T4E_10872 [Trichinella pseudospiralis]